MKAALYARVSTDDKNQNPDTQVYALRQFCERANWEIYEEYVDYARAKDFRGRKGWQRLQRDARMRRFKVVLVFRLDRAFRSVRECVNCLQDWEERGIAFRSLKEDVIDTITSMGKFALHVLAAAAELESAVIGERVKAGMARAKTQGRRIGRKPLDIHSQTICETISALGNVRAASLKLVCSVPYIYKMLTPLGLNPSRIAKGEQRYSQNPEGESVAGNCCPGDIHKGGLF